MFFNNKKKLIVYEEKNGKFIPKTSKNSNSTYAQSAILASPIFGMIPSYAQAETVDPVSNGLHSTVMGLFDTAVVFIIIFAGVAWSIGNRTKAVHLLISCCAGYLLARNAINIRDLLKSAGGGSFQ